MYDPLFLLDTNGCRIAAIYVEPGGEDLLLGSVEWIAVPDDMLELFAEFEELVVTQQFTSVDEVQDQMHALGLIVEYPDGTRESPDNLQVYPSTNGISFHATDTARQFVQQPRVLTHQA